MAERRSADISSWRAIARSQVVRRSEHVSEMLGHATLETTALYGNSQKLRLTRGSLVKKRCQCHTPDICPQRLTCTLAA